jgi:tRNA (cmo5U34)-methyltransferase
MLGSGLSGEGLYDYKNIGGCFPATDEALRVLDIGCGTGIELDHIWNRTPNARITCVDISPAMLDLLIKNHPGRGDSITVVEASYVDWDYPPEAFDIAVSHATMHHFWPEEKIGIYRKVLGALKPGGHYLEGDFMVDAISAEHYRRRYHIITAGLPDKAGAGEYHIDIPCTVDVQKGLLLEAGFGSVESLYENIQARGSGAILKAVKR